MQVFFQCSTDYIALCCSLLKSCQTRESYAVHLKNAAWIPKFVRLVPYTDVKLCWYLFFILTEKQVGFFLVYCSGTSSNADDWSSGSDE